MRWPRRSHPPSPPEPDPPTDVRVTYADGHVATVHCVYVGDDMRGVHYWQAVAPVRSGLLPTAIQAETLPPRTHIVVDIG